MSVPVTVPGELPEAAPVPKYSARELAELLHTDPNKSVEYPTDDQAGIIEGPLEPLLVIAGAGSGKTKTMADRVVWLVANELVRPEEILGVTFTRKAAGELASRIRARLNLLYHQLDAGPGGAADPDTAGGGEERMEPSVSTYHSYANGIVNDYGLRIGVERDSVMLGGAQSWQLANEVVEAYSGEYEHFTAAKSTLVGAVLQMAGECSEHLRTPAEVRAELEAHVAAVTALPYQFGKPKEPTQAARKLINRLRTRISVTELVEAYRQAKAERRQLDFGDLVELAARIAATIPEAVEMERAKFKVVLLDEFQDTSHAQMVLFSNLFGDGRSVTAVGDPHQSIYGFRGASAGQLGTFREKFPLFTDNGRELAPLANLSVAWRNSTSVLAAANTVSTPLNGVAPWLKHQRLPHVPELQAKPNAPVGEVYLGRYLCDVSVEPGKGTPERILGEAEAVAEQVAFHRSRKAELGGHDDRGKELTPTVAVLCRGRKQFEPIRKELEQRGIPVQIVGLGGLLSTPEVVDLLAVLRVLGDPGRSDSMLRILAGARWRIGPADLMALADWSRHLVRVRERAVRVADAADIHGPDEGPDLVVEADLVEAGSLVEAVDSLPRAGWVSNAGRSLSEEGLRRLTRLRNELRDLRGFVGEDLTTLIGEVERRILLDIEVAAKPGVTLHESRRNLDAFIDAAATFSSSAERVDLAAFLAWLEAANTEENGLPVTPLEPSREAVQLLTVHASKGLEWDIVVVPGLNEASFPNDKDSRWSSGDAAIPWTLRGDSLDLPQWDWEQVDQKSWLESEKLFSEDAKGHAEREERRLAYVAFTRAKSVLICTSSAWGGGRSKPLAPSRYLQDLYDLEQSGASGYRLLHWVATEDEGTENPANAEAERAVWPVDPLGPRRQAMEAAAEAVLESAGSRAAKARNLNGAVGEGPGQGEERLHGQDPEPADTAAASLIGRWSRETELVLARHRPPNEVVQVELPAHISASMLVDLKDNPAEVTRQLRRPVPRQPGMAARKGTAFHAWVEEFFGTSGMLDIDEYPGAADAYVDEAYQLEDMIATFEASDWAQRTPAFIEVPVETKVDTVVVRGRIDAVFQDADGTWDLIDWKTGAPPSSQKLDVRSVQLAVYRLAWARLKGVPLEQVRAAFYYVAADKLVRPYNLAGEDELEEIIREAAKTPSAGY